MSPRQEADTAILPAIQFGDQPERHRDYSDAEVDRRAVQRQLDLIRRQNASGSDYDATWPGVVMKALAVAIIAAAIWLVLARHAPPPPPAERATEQH